MLFHCTVGGELKVLLSNRVLFHFFFRFLFWRHFEKNATSKTTVGNPSVIEEHLEFSNCERGVQRVGFKNSESYLIRTR